MTKSHRLTAQCLLCLLMCVAFQAAISAPLLELTKANFHTPLLPHADYFVDESGQATIDDIQKPGLANQFTPVGARQLLLGGVTGAVWIRFTIRDLSGSDAPIMLELQPADITSIRVFEALNGQNREVYNGGLKIPFKDRPVQLTPFVIELDASSSNHRTWYMQLSSDNYLQLRATVADYNRYLSSTATREWFAGDLFGGLFLLILLNLVFSLMFHERTYIWHALYIIAHVGHLSASLGYAYQLFDDKTHWLHTDFAVFTFVAQCFTLLVLKDLAEFDDKQKALKQWFTILLAVNTVAVILVLVLGVALSGPLTYLIVLATTVSIILAALLQWYRSHNTPFLFLGISKLWILLGAFVASTSMSFGLIDSESTELWMVTAVLMETLMITLALLYRTSSLYRRNLYRQQREALAQQAADNLKTMFSRIGHDVRTPMNGILGMAELLHQTPLSNNQQEYVRGISSSGHALLNRINQVIDLIKLQSGDIELQLAPFDLKELAENCVNAYRFEAADRNLEFVVDAEETLPCMLKGDANRLKQVLMAMLGNAFAHTEQGEIYLKVRAKPRGNQCTVSFKVIDTGRGMDKELTSALEKSYSSDMMENISGGLETVNLLLARDIAKTMQAQFIVENQDSQGSSAFFSVQLDIDSTVTTADSDLDELLAEKEILIVDDNASYRKVLSQICSSWGMRAKAARSGAEALAMIKSRLQLDRGYDLILMDQNMPGMDGLEAAEKMQGLRSIPVILLTGLDINLSAEDCERCGIVSSQLKPISGKNLRHQVSEALSQPDHNTPVQANHILIAEDNAVSAQVLSGMLNRLNTPHTTVRNGHEALMAIKENNYDLILMDCEMPGMDGFEASDLIRAWQSQHQGTTTPIIALSALAEEELEQRIHRHGMDDFLTKPVDIAHLRNAIQQWAGTDTTQAN